MEYGNYGYKTEIIVAAVANLPLAMANVALPSIGAYFDASQTQLDLVAVAYSLGLACSVLWLGALGDRYGRKMMLLLGVALSLPAGLIAAGVIREAAGDYRQRNLEPFVRRLTQRDIFHRCRLIVLHQLGQVARPVREAGKTRKGA